jgi:uncharacterized protein YkvS
MAKQVHFSGKLKKTIELKDGSKVTVKGIIDYATLEASLTEKEKPTTADHVHSALRFLKSVILSWDLIDEVGNVVEYKPELVDTLSVEVINEIVEKTMPLYNLEKKSDKP